MRSDQPLQVDDGRPPVAASPDGHQPPELAEPNGGTRPADGQPSRDADGSARPGELSRRLSQLPPGHPSSPYETDGSPKSAAPRLRDLELPETSAADPEAPEGDLSEPDPNYGSDPPDSNPRKQGPDSPGSDRPDSGIAAANFTGTEIGELQRADTEMTEFERPEAHAADSSRPLTDQEHAEHVADVRGRLEKARADGLATHHQYTIDPAKETWSDDRDAQHYFIIDDLYSQASDVPNDYKAIIAGGLGGAGKTTVLAEHANIDRSQYLTINPDDIKTEMARRGMIPEVEGLSPMEASDLAHEESSYIAKRIAMRAQSDGKNVLWDITMSSRASTERRVDELRSSSYTYIEAIFVDIPIETSISRVDARHREGNEDWRIGRGFGGRTVPPEIVRAQNDSDWGSVNRKIFEALKPRFDSWSRYDNSIDGRTPVLAESEAHPEELLSRLEEIAQ